MKYSAINNRSRITYIILCIISVLICIVFTVSDQLKSDYILYIGVIILDIGILKVIYTIYSNGLLSGQVKIDSTAIELITPNKKTSIAWNEINYIVISRKFGSKFIGIFTKDFQKEFNTKKNYYTYENSRINLLSSSFAYYYYKKEIILEIKKYYHNDIINEYEIYYRS